MKEQIKEDFLIHLEKPNFKYQLDLFKKIYYERASISELTGEYLLSPYDFQWHWQFLHVLPKGSYPQMKLFEWNILLALPEEHEKQEQYKTFNERKGILTQVYYEVIYGKEY